jgi:hypothetical protein
VAIALRHGQDRAVVFGDEKGAVRAFLEVGEVTVFVEDLSDEFDLVGEGETDGADTGTFETALGAAVEDALEECRVFVFDVFEEFVR